MDYRIKIAILIAIGVAFVGMVVAGLIVFARVTQKWIGDAEKRKMPDAYPLLMAAGLLLGFGWLLRSMMPLFNRLINWIGNR